MSPNLRIATRFLLAKKRSMLMSLAGIAFGVGFFIVTQAQTSGFEDFFIRTILGTDGAIRIEDKIQDTMRSMAAGGAHSKSKFMIANRGSVKYIEGVDWPNQVREALKSFHDVSAISEVVRGDVTIRSALRKGSAQVFGIHLQDHLEASDLGHQIILGRLESFRENPMGVLIGSKLADRLQVSVGDSVVLATQGQEGRFRVSAVYETGVTDIDKVRLYVHMSEARSLLKRPHGASFIQLALFNPDRAPVDAYRMTQVLHYSATSWEERQATWLSVFKALRVSAALTVSTIILISGLGMFNTLAMIVMEKTREISILRSMGYSRRDISRIFLWQGVIVLAIGTVVGWMLGAGVTFAVSKLPIQIRGIFSSDTFVVSWSIWHYVEATVTAVVIVMFASLVPARRAARLEPGDVIRGTSQ